MSIKTPYPGSVKSFPDKSVKTRSERQRYLYHLFSVTSRAKRMRTESRHRFLPAAAFRFRGLLIERHPEALFLSPNDCARVDFVFRVNNQRELVRNASMRPDLESDTCCR